MIRDLIETLYLEHNTLVVTKMEGMEIKEIKVLDKDRKFVRFADITKVKPYLKLHKVEFIC